MFGEDFANFFISTVLYDMLTFGYCCFFSGLHLYLYLYYTDIFRRDKKQISKILPNVFPPVLSIAVLSVVQLLSASI